MAQLNKLVTELRDTNLSRLPSLDDACGKHFTYRDFVECGGTWKANAIDNVPKQFETYASLARLATEILDPVVDQFGGAELTYGFSGAELAKCITQGIAPKIDQHASHELSSRGMTICDRGGAACDFRVHNVDSLTVAQWVVRTIEFDRLYYYGKRSPIHISVAARPKHQVVLVKRDVHGRMLHPSVISIDKFLKIRITDKGEQQ
jgi:hypothetical protein